MIFKLMSTYELIDSQPTINTPIRIEIFNSKEDEYIFRARVWVKTTYNVYPMLINTDTEGENLQSIHSSDDFNNDITSIIAEEPSIMIGVRYDSEELFLKYVISLINKNWKSNK